STGPGTFGSPTTFAMGTNAWGVALADFNGDTRLDVVTANQGSNTVSVRLGTGTGSFGATTNFSVGTGSNGPRFVAVADVNGDGRLALATANVTTNTASILLGTGTGTFGAATLFATGISPNTALLVDLNNDGAPDLSTADFGSNTVSVRLNA